MGTLVDAIVRDPCYQRLQFRRLNEGDANAWERISQADRACSISSSWPLKPAGICIRDNLAYYIRLLVLQLCPPFRALSRYRFQTFRDLNANANTPLMLMVHGRYAPQVGLAPRLAISPDYKLEMGRNLESHAATPTQDVALPLWPNDPLFLNDFGYTVYDDRPPCTH